MKLVKENLRKNEGFSLVEIIIAIFILSIIVASTAGAFLFSTKTTLDNEIRMNTINIANETIEKIRALPFSEVGTKFLREDGTYIDGDPAGDILQEEIRQINGIDYLVKVNINWEEQADWDLAGNAQWDYKSVRVSVTPQGNTRYSQIEQTIETYVARDSTQPALSGSNIRIRCKRGWKLPGESLKVVQGINVLLSSGPDAIRFVQTSSKGIASFLNLTHGNHEVTVDLASKGFMIHPNQESILEEMKNIEFEENKNKTVPFDLEVEEPCSLRIFLKDLAGNPIVSDRLRPDAEGKIILKVPYPADDKLEVTFSPDDIDNMGGLSEGLITNLWPVGEGYVGVYHMEDLTLDKLEFLGDYVKTGTSEELWDGRFSAPGEIKDIIVYLNIAPTTPIGITTNWVDESKAIRIGSYKAVDDGGNPLLGGVLKSNDLSETLIMPENSETYFNGLKLYVENSGTSTTPGLLLKKNSTLNLHGREIIFRGSIEVERVNPPATEGKIYLSTRWEDGRETSDIDGSKIDANEDILYGKLYLSEPIYSGENIIVSAGAYYFPNGTVLPDHSSKLIPITKENYIE